MWTWGAFGFAIGFLSIALSLMILIGKPDDTNIPAMLIWFATGLVETIQGLVYINTANRITKLEQFVEGKLAQEEQNSNEDSPSNQEQAIESQNNDPEIISKLNALDPQSRRVVESVIDAESKRSVE